MVENVKFIYPGVKWLRLIKVNFKVNVNILIKLKENLNLICDSILFDFFSLIQTNLFVIILKISVLM